MATPTRDLKVQFLGDANSLIRAADKAKKALGDTETAAKKADDKLGLLRNGAGLLAGAFAASQIKDFVGDSLNLAVAAEEAGNKFNAVFGPAAADLRDKMSELGDKAGVADFELQNIVGTTGNVVLGLGGTRDEAAKLVEKLAPLAVDLASFNGEVDNSPAVLQAMTSALTGEREALKTYGVVIKEADVQQRALQMSGKDAASELTNLEKAAATAELIMEGAGAAVGDLDRNLGSAATQQAQLSAEWKEAQAALGQELLPAMQQFVDLARDMVPLLGGVASVVGDAAEGFSAFAQGFTSNRSFVDVIELNTVLEETARLAGESTDTVHTAGTALATLALHGELSAAAMQQVQEATGASNEEMKAAAERANDYAKEHEFAEDAIRDLDEATGFYTGVVDRQGEAMGDAKDEAAMWARTLDDKATPAQEDLEEATDDATQSLAEQRDELRKAADPVFALRDAQQKLIEKQEVLNQLAADGKEGTEEYRDAQLDLIEASGDLEYQEGLLSDSVTGPNGSIAAFRDLAEGAGLTKEQIDEIIESILRYNETDPEGKTFGFEVKLPGGGTGFRVGGPGGPIATQHGGVIKARSGGTHILAGEAGTDEAVVPLNNEGARFLQNALGGVGGGAPVNITVNGFVGSEQALAAEIDRLLTRRSRTSGLGFR